ncbi:MAG: formylglycine-generating enzyme family protein [Anaerolineae bacterium]|nr:formylglycine-generating enzyme family protein [Anaerolineae bacterium]
MPLSSDLLPSPFAWAYIPDGKVSLIDVGGYVQTIKSYKVNGFQMAQYPITNAQYRLFIDADGYHTQKYWTSSGWLMRISENWLQPLYWDDAIWNGSDYPVVGVSWYEAVAYCRWLSELTDEIITLPTEQQWQYVAGGDEAQEYPWGSGWDVSRCNHNVGGMGLGRTTPVNQFEGLGDSPFGVVDMVGNIWEWTLTIFDTGTTELDGSSERQVCGSGWNSSDPDDMQIWRRKFRSFRPQNRNNVLGFRIVCLYE